MKKRSATTKNSSSKKNLVFFLVLLVSIVTTSFALAYLKVNNEEKYQLGASAAGNGWESGASCEGVPDGSFAAWRGSPVTVAGTWNDASLAVQKEQWSMSSGGEYKDWTGSIDNAVGAFWGGSWQAAARGDYDANIRTALQVINSGWGNKKTVYLRYAHEFNGDWYQWKVTPSDNEYFKQASIRFYNLVQQELVAKGRDARVAWAPNSDEHNGLNTELSWPGDQYVDVVAVDWYDWGVLNTQAKWDAAFMQKGASGGPFGIGAWQAFAAKHGKPLAFSEWGPTGDTPTEDPFFIQKMNEFMSANAGTGPGQVAYDVYFNCTGYVKNGKELFQIYPSTALPQTAAMYKSLKWGKANTGTPSATINPTIIPTAITSPTLLPTATNIPAPTNTPVPTATPVPTTTVPTITFRSSTSSTNGSGSKSLLISKPSGVTAGDVLVAEVAVQNASTSITPPSGWSLIRTTQTSSSMKMATFYKLAGTTEGVSYTWTLGSNQAATGAISAYSGVNKTSPIQTSSGKYNDSTGTVSFSQVSTSVANSMVLAFVSVSGNTTVTPPSGLTERYDLSNKSSSNGKTVEMSQQLKTTTGTTSVGNGKEDSLNKSNLTQIVVLRPQ